MNTSMSSLFQYKIKTFYKQQTELQTANSGSIYFCSWEYHWDLTDHDNNYIHFLIASSSDN